MKEEQLVNQLTSVFQNGNSNSGCVPDYLSKKYDKEGAAMLLGEIEQISLLGIGALIKSSLTDEEEDVRLASLESLFKQRSELCKAIAYFLLDDEYIEVSEFCENIIKP
jgi:hypothetical protein